MITTALQELLAARDIAATNGSTKTAGSLSWAVALIREGNDATACDLLKQATWFTEDADVLRHIVEGARALGEAYPGDPDNRVELATSTAVSRLLATPVYAEKSQVITELLFANWGGSNYETGPAIRLT